MEKVHLNNTIYIDENNDIYYSLEELKKFGGTLYTTIRKNTRLYKSTWDELTENQKEQVRAFFGIEDREDEWWYIFDRNKYSPKLAYQSDKDMGYIVVSGWEADKGMVKFGGNL